MRSEPPLTLRRVFGPPDEVALCLVGSAAGPLAGDELRLELEVAAGARACLTATGAAIAQGRGGAASTVGFGARVGAGGDLDADPGALVVAEGSRVDVSVTLDLAADASATWHELVVLGRGIDTAPGAARLRWDVVRDGRPLLRQDVDSRDLAGHRVMASVFLTAPDLDARTLVGGPAAVAQRVDDRTVLITVLGTDAAGVRRELDALLAQFPATSERDLTRPAPSRRRDSRPRAPSPG